MWKRVDGKEIGGRSGATSGYNAKNATVDTEKGAASTESAQNDQEVTLAVITDADQTTSPNLRSDQKMAESSESKPARKTMRINFSSKSKQDLELSTQLNQAEGTTKAAKARGNPQEKDQQKGQDKPYTVVRSAGGRKWSDDSLLEWDPQHFRLFVGNLGRDVTTEILELEFAVYPSMAKARVVMDKKLGTTKGYGFVAFADSKDYLRAFQEKNGKYIGSQPVTLKRAEATVAPTKKFRKR